MKVVEMAPDVSLGDRLVEELLADRTYPLVPLAALQKRVDEERQLRAEPSLALGALELLRPGPFLLPLPMRQLVR